jgi:hypothetical protein
MQMFFISLHLGEDVKDKVLLTGSKCIHWKMEQLPQQKNTLKIGRI